MVEHVQIYFSTAGFGSTAMFPSGMARPRTEPFAQTGLNHGNYFSHWDVTEIVP